MNARNGTCKIAARKMVSKEDRPNPDEIASTGLHLEDAAGSSGFINRFSLLPRPQGVRENLHVIENQKRRRCDIKVAWYGEKRNAMIPVKMY
jgi:hypothetical protein